MRNIWSLDGLFYAIIDDDDNEMAPEDVVNELTTLRAEISRLKAGIARITDDYYADYEEDTQLALSEMREALMALLAKDGE